MELSSLQNELRSLEMSMHAYGHAMSCLSFDAATVAPRGSAEARGMTQAFLSEQQFKLLVNDRTRELLDELKEREEELDGQTRRRVEILSEQLDNLSRIPPEEYAAHSRLINDSADKWRTAKENSDYALFEPYLDRVVSSSRRIAAYRDNSKPAYDVMLDEFEKGMDMATLDPLFDMLRSKLSPALAGIKGQPAAPAFLSARCPIEKQRELAYALMDMMGVDRRHCILAETEHPFTTGSSKYDVRITTHYYPDAFLSSMYSVIHESGHALYELGIADEYQFTALADGASMGMHESQSRFFENLVGHSEGFLRFLSPTLRRLFPDALEGVDDALLIRGANRVEPSLVRTEADEVTYPLHIMIRYELEKRLIAGTLSTKELPEAWNAMYKDYLGVDVPNDTMGVLQDMHWSEGMFGYFPTYALGSAYASQFMHAMRADLDVDALLEKGELAPIVDWLRERVHRFGMLYPPKELIKRVTGENFNPDYYVRHLLGRVSSAF